MHGNSLVRAKDLKGEKESLSDIVNTSFFNNNLYRIQNFFENTAKTELFFSKPTYKEIIFYGENNKYNLKSGESLVIDTHGKNIINIKSNCFFFKATNI
jgi:hypothetical protein